MGCKQPYYLQVVGWAITARKRHIASQFQVVMYFEDGSNKYLNECSSALASKALMHRLAEKHSISVDGAIRINASGASADRVKADARASLGFTPVFQLMGELGKFPWLLEDDLPF